MRVFYFLGVIMSKIIYNKPYLSPNEHIRILQQKGLIFNDVSYANRGGKSTGYPITRPNKLRRFLRNYEQYMQQGTPI